MRPVDKSDNKPVESQEKFLSESALKRAQELLEQEKLTFDQFDNILRKFKAMGKDSVSLEEFEQMVQLSGRC